MGRAHDCGAPATRRSACAPASRPDPPAFLSIGQVCVECGGSAEHIVGCADVIALELEYAAESARKIGPILEGEPIPNKRAHARDFRMRERADAYWSTHPAAPIPLGPIPLGPIPLGPIPLGPIPLGPMPLSSCRRRRRPRLLEGHGLARAQWWARPGGTTPLGAHVRESGGGERRGRLCAAGGRAVLCVEVLSAVADRTLRVREYRRVPRGSLVSSLPCTPRLRQAQRVEATAGRPGAAVRLSACFFVCLFVCLFALARPGDDYTQYGRASGGCAEKGEPWVNHVYSAAPGAPHLRRDSPLAAAHTLHRD